MNKSLQCIQQKSGDIQSGLLRFRDKHGQLTLQVKATPNEDASFNCVVTEHSENKRWVNRHVNLVQKRQDDYLYISGKVYGEVTKGSPILSVRIFRACWFVRESRGNLSWLTEKYIYEIPEKELRAATG